MTIFTQQGDHEDLFFKKKDEEFIKTLREKAAKDSNQKYRNEHKGHCFRCGSQSLAEIRHGDITVDVCINEGCGAVHLDPGELEAIQQAFPRNQNPISKMTNALFSVFKS
ncbi:MAG: zf-TFIIB domain-containing protein [bacterium]